MATKSFELTDYSSSLFYVMAILPGAGTALLLYLALSGTAAGFLAYVSGITAVITIALLYAGYVANNISFQVSADEVKVVAPMYGRTIKRSSLQLGGARKVDISVDVELDPVRRTNGIGTEKIRCGWFELKDGSKALVALTDAANAVYVPTDDGFSLLLSPSDPDGFLAALGQS